GTAASRATAARQAALLRPDVALIDLSLSEGLGLARDIVAAGPSVKVVALAVRESEPEVVAWAEAGITAYVPRDASLDDLVAAIKRLPSGEMLCSARIAGGLFRRVGALQQGRQPASCLTAREAEIVGLVERGLS